MSAVEQSPAVPFNEVTFRYNPLAGREFPENRYARELELRRLLVPLARRQRAIISEGHHLLPMDVCALVHNLVLRVCEPAFYPRGKSVTFQMSMDCITAALRITAIAFDFPKPEWAWTVQLGNRLERWRWENRDWRPKIVGREPSMRDMLLPALDAYVCRHFGPEVDHPQFRGAMRRAMESLRMDHNEAGRYEPVRDDDVSSMLSLVRRKTYNTGGAIYIGADDKINFSQRDARDVVAKELEISREAPPERVPEPVEDCVNPESRERQPEDIAHDDEFEEAVIALQEMKRAACKEGSKAHAILGHLAEHILDGVSETAIAKATKTTVPYVSKTFRSATAGLAASRAKRR